MIVLKDLITFKPSEQDLEATIERASGCQRIPGATRGRDHENANRFTLLHVKLGVFMASVGGGARHSLCPLGLLSMKANFTIIHTVMNMWGSRDLKLDDLALVANREFYRRSPTSKQVAVFR